MAWLRFSDDWNRRPEIRALDDGTYRVLHSLIEAAEHFDACGIVTDDYAMAVYPHGSRRKLRERVRKLADLGLVHLLHGPDDSRAGCPTCEARMTEAGAEAMQKHAQRHPLSASASAPSGRTEAMLICIRSFFDVAIVSRQLNSDTKGL